MGLNEYQYRYRENKYFLKYAKQRDKIKEKYSDILVGNWAKSGPPPKKPIPYDKEERDRFKEYLKEMGDLMFEPNGWFQKFIWDDLSEVEKLDRLRKSRVRLNASKYL